MKKVICLGLFAALIFTLAALPAEAKQKRARTAAAQSAKHKKTAADSAVSAKKPAAPAVDTAATAKTKVISNEDGTVTLAN